MATSPLAPQDIDNLRDFASKWGKIVVRQVYGEAGPELDCDLLTFEQLAQTASQGLLEGVLSALLELHAQKLQEQQPCPKCKKQCSVRREPRLLQCLGGTVNYHEPVCYCSACRRDFFPLATAVGSGRPSVHA